MVADMLKVNKTLISLECAALSRCLSVITPVFVKTSVAITLTRHLLLVPSLADNNLTDYGQDMSGVLAIAEALKANASLTKVSVPSVALRSASAADC